MVQDLNSSWRERVLLLPQESWASGGPDPVMGCANVLPSTEAAFSAWAGSPDLRPSLMVRKPPRQCSE